MPQTILNKLLQDEIALLAKTHGISADVLEKFADFTIVNFKKKDPKPKPLTGKQLKEAVCKHFDVKDIKELKKSSGFQLATSSMGKLDLSKNAGWEMLYRKFIDVLPNEANEKGHGCINGINIFKYDMPWRTFGLDPKTSSTEDIKSAYHQLSKIYHPDTSSTGDAEVFDRLTVFYKSLTYKF
ncbi:DnaJ domain-containing protein [Phormidium sp. CLA17]|uniref:DnaJ domain-containing protein n=1 Tax=Leptolyngbya sp. Cla-17 TaxID=2803751 RepID=UPI0014910512|nr:DnaJ domain-containing protein [Leptolyngbya sp. Cla-17]MBM0743002.1 DnaJ domain-containing protein [Leptolyngbya sp. Cla-17]